MDCVWRWTSWRGTVAEKFVYQTADGGLTWNLRSELLFGGETPPAGIGQAPSPSVEDMVFTSTQDGWTGTAIGLYRTQDGGNTWTSAPGFDPQASVERLFFVDATSGFLAGYLPPLEATDDGGLHWRRLAPLP
jgi:photosystem II stability/assembly factor-like uncharacterized protein